MAKVSCRGVLVLLFFLIWKQTRYLKVRDQLSKLQPTHTMKCASGTKTDIGGVFLNMKSCIKTEVEEFNIIHFAYVVYTVIY